MLSFLAPWLRFWPLALALAAFAAGWTVQGWRWEAKQADALKAADDARLKQEQSAAEHSAKLEEKLAALDSANRTLTRRLSGETRKEAYRCPVPAAGLGLLNAARLGKAGDAAGEPDGAVPGPGEGAGR